MTSQERFAAACDHRLPDRAPVDYQAKRDADALIRAHLGVASERELLDALGCDFYYLSGRDISQNEAALPIYRGPALPTTETERVCPFGIRYQRSAYDFKFGADEVIRGPLEDAESPRDVLRHPWPEPRWFDPEPLLAECEAFADKVIVSGFWTAIFGNAYRMHGFANFLMNMALRPELIRTLVNRMTDFYLELNDRLFSALRGRIHLYYFGNDFGSQSGLLFSPKMWLDFYREPYERLIGLAHSYGLKVMAHSCGGIAELIRHFIDAGVDILDPVQTTAEGMDPRALKDRFGDRLVFHGAIDTQEVLPKGSVEEVRRHCTETLETLGAGGGYLFASCNAIQADTPMANVEAMYETARQHAAGGIRR